MKRKKKNNFKRAIVFVIILGIFLTLAATLRILRIETFSETNNEAVFNSLTNYSEITSASTFDQIKNSKNKNVIMFTANWCGSCLRMKEQLKTAASKYSDIKFYVADIESNRDESSSYNVAITPALVVIEKSNFNTYQEVNSTQLENIIDDFALRGL